MSTAVVVPVEEYLSTSYEPDREYVDGRLVERNVGEYDHSRLQYLIGVYLGAREDQVRICGFTEQRVRIPQRKRFRIPDVCVMPVPHKREPVLTEPPLLVVEILSPDDTVAELIDRIEDFLTLGVKSIWIVDPRKRTVATVDADGTQPVRDLRPASETPAGPLVVDFNEIFQKLS
jgi:Uma2 family endonuclease